MIEPTVVHAMRNSVVTAVFGSAAPDDYEIAVDYMDITNDR